MSLVRVKTTTVCAAAAAAVDGGGGDWQRLRKLMSSLIFGCAILVSIGVDKTVDGSPRRQNDGCRFPSEWRGRYFQGGLGEITISDNAIKTKGTCVERYQDYFLMDNREQNCFSCLLIIRQHRNVIQYKESYCSTASSVLKTVCNELRVETPLYTLVREQAAAVKCPFSDAYYFNYNDLVHEYCARPLSYAKPCSAHTKYQLRFNHCVSTALFTGRDLDLECLATWKDGSEMFLYGRMTGAGLDSKDDRYRCFKYQHHGTDVQLAMSADATCHGLRSATDGPFMMAFSRDTAGWPSSSCLFPDWLRAIGAWRDLNDQWRFSIDDTSQTLVTSSSTGGGKQRHNTANDMYEYRCRHTDSASGGADVVTIHTFTVQNCIAKFQCLRFRRLSGQAVEVRYGTLSDHDSHSRCSTDNYRTTNIFIPDGPLSLTPCPRPGVYHTAPTDGCLHRMTVGCQNESTVVIDHSCSPVGSPGVGLECVAWWNASGDTTYVIVRRQTNNVECFSFRLEGGKAVFGTDATCSANNTTMTSRKRDHILTYSITRNENCRNTPLRGSSSGSNPAGGGGSGPNVISSVAPSTTRVAAPNGPTIRPFKTIPPQLPAKPPPTQYPQQSFDDDEEDYDEDDEDDDDVIGPPADRKYRARDVIEGSGDDRPERPARQWTTTRRPPPPAARRPTTKLPPSAVSPREKLIGGRPSSSGSSRPSYPDESNSFRPASKQQPEVRTPLPPADSSRRRDAVTHTPSRASVTRIGSGNAGAASASVAHSTRQYSIPFALGLLLWQQLLTLYVARNFRYF